VTAADLIEWIDDGPSLAMAGLGIGLLFGAAAQRSRFCLRAATVEVARGGLGEKLAIWLIAFGTAVVLTQSLMAMGWLDVSGARQLAARGSYSGALLGGLMFGAGMVLARGCASRLTVLAGTGNLRALATMLVLAVLAHATLKGALAPARAWISAGTVDMGGAASLARLPGGAPLWAAVIVAALVAGAVASRARLGELAMGAAIGALVPLGWLGTGFLLYDEFAPLPLESLAFTSAATEGLFWWVAGTAVAPTFGVGLLAGVVAGSLVSAAVARRLAWTGFTADTPTGRYLAGGAMMGIGGVLAGGCTVGAGLAGISMLSVAAVLALGSIVAGAVAMRLVDERRARGVVAVPAA
jgi:uncharacterized protein